MRKWILRSLFLAACVIAVSSLQSQTRHSDAELRNTPYWVDMMQQQDVNFYDVQHAFNLYWENRVITRGSGWKPFKRWEYWMGQRINPDGTLPAPDRDMNAYQAYFGNKNNKELFGDWTPLGPFTVPSGYNGYRGLGRIASIAFHPTDPNTIYVGAPAGGLWVTTDHGENWETHTDILPTLGVSSIAIDYTNPDVIYIGTGDRDAGDAPGLGVWKSTDNGLTFAASNTGMGNTTVGRLLMHPTDPSFILAATANGMYKTTNGGESWTRTINGNFKDVVFKPNDASIVYAAAGGNFYRSTDAGDNFTLVNNGLPGGARAVIAVTPADPEIVYFFITNSDSFKGLYRSTDAGLTFTTRSTSPNIMSWDCAGGSGGQAWYDLDMAADPTNSNVIFGGGVNNFKSSNGGQTWAISSHWWGDCGVPAVHADLHVLEYNPVNGRLYAGNDGGIYWTDNGGLNWTEFTNGLVISQAYKIGQSLTQRDYVINGYQDNGTSTFTGSNWVAVYGGDGMECAIDPTDHRYSYATVYYGEIFRLFNNNNQGRIAGQGSNGITEGGAWVTPFVIDHENPNVMFVGYNNVWRSTNIKAGNTSLVSWTQISTMSSSNMNVLAQSRANLEVLYAASGNRLYRSDNVKDDAVNWTNLTATLPVTNSITAIETSPIDENIVYIAQQNRIYKSLDKGTTWQNITGTLPDVNFNTIAYYRNSSEGLYLGTDIGIFYRDASMNDWIAYSDGFPASGRVTEIEIYYDPADAANDLLRAGTYGRGLWSSPPYFGTLQADFEASTTTPSAGCGINFTDLTAGVPYTWEWTFEGATPSSSTDKDPQNISYPQEGTYTVSLTVTNPIGSDTKTVENYITVGPAVAPAVAFEASERNGCSGLAVKFTDLTENCPDAWLWSFAPNTVSFVNGTTAESQHPEVVFNDNVAYDVTLTATNQVGSASETYEKYITVGGLAIPFVEDFESGTPEATGWIIENPDNGRTWESKVLTDGKQTVWMNFFNYTNMTARDNMVSIVLNFSTFDQVFLGFDYAYATRYTQKDSLIVSLSSDCGQTWERVYANGPDGAGAFETAPATTTFFEPADDASWCTGNENISCPIIDLSAWAGMANIKLRFESYNNFGNNLYLDNIEVSSTVGLISGNAGEALLSVFPNPANSELNINVAKNLIGKAYQVTDISGRVVLNGKLDSTLTTIKSDNLDKGTYLLHLNGSQLPPVKIIILH
ncbi:MAG: PKD domain-containing protein [Bacteroidales bacterium]|nr:PKD domain-containing protein [Bacteroidales bacterium]